ncbi:hypothetical protein BKA67DRAFT_351709 [Truncatella angustata]|uniref:Zn(2)-C6 fungal-type domain-containing protein n=1 Tax=Truncatella angustata TaxID=152316 RepID=A0A9P8UHE9_9PEZI|nr:uncharacterized protein BKA67DRAFT_351709 [Truncatella angustata]KAH6652269.1 hypothetical protein BKA67DRAFT_351709 [Truncatella angustata]
MTSDAVSMAAAPADRRRRLAKACDPCRKRKLRCDGVRPVCTRCHHLTARNARSAPCHYADVHKLAARPRRRRNPEDTSRQHEAHSASPNPPLPGEDDLGSSNNDSPASRLPPNVAVGAHSPSRSTRSQQIGSAASATPLREDARRTSSGSTWRAESVNIPRPVSDTIVGGSADMRFFGMRLHMECALTGH